MEDGSPFFNVYYNGEKPDGTHFGFNMGGCMGCHGNAQVNGSDFSFIIGSSTSAPQTVDAELPDLEKYNHSFGAGQ